MTHFFLLIRTVSSLEGYFMSASTFPDRVIRRFYCIRNAAESVEFRLVIGRWDLLFWPYRKRFKFDYTLLGGGLNARSANPTKIHSYAAFHCAVLFSSVFQWCALSIDAARVTVISASLEVNVIDTVVTTGRGVPGESKYFFLVRVSTCLQTARASGFRPLYIGRPKIFTQTLTRSFKNNVESGPFLEGPSTSSFRLLHFHYILLAQAFQKRR